MARPKKKDERMSLRKKVLIVLLAAFVVFIMVFTSFLPFLKGG
jgi:sensor domain CHASE-containing protein